MIRMFVISGFAVCSAMKFGALLERKRRMPRQSKNRLAGVTFGHGQESMLIQSFALVTWSAVGMRVGPMNLFKIAPTGLPDVFRSLSRDTGFTLMQSKKLLEQMLTARNCRKFMVPLW